jgi:hypothetical protein
MAAPTAPSSASQAAPAYQPRAEAPERRLRRMVAFGPRCPDCGGPLAFGEGCSLCPVCGYSGCPS